MEPESRAPTIERNEADATPVPEAGVGATTPWRRRGVTIAWGLGVAALALFLAIGSASIQVGSRLRFRRSLPLADVWSRFVEEVADGRSATLVRIGLYGATAVVLVGAALGLWLAMTADEGRRGPGGSRHA